MPLSCTLFDFELVVSVKHSRFRRSTNEENLIHQANLTLGISERLAFLNNMPDQKVNDGKSAVLS